MAKVKRKPPVKFAVNLNSFSVEGERKPLKKRLDAKASIHEVKSSSSPFTSKSAFKEDEEEKMYF